MLNKQQIFNDFVVWQWFSETACATQYEFIVVNGQTMTFAFHKVVQQQYSGEMGKTMVFTSSFFVMLRAKNY